jgi:chorismate mutase
MVDRARLRAWQDALARLAADPPQSPDQPSPADLEPWRDRIDAIDEILAELLNERARFAAEIGHLKRRMDLPVYAPEREQEVLRNVLRASPGPLPPDAVRRLFERIIDETRSLERRLASSEDAGDEQSNA